MTIATAPVTFCPRHFIYRIVRGPITRPAYAPGQSLHRARHFDILFCAPNGQPPGPPVKRPNPPCPSGSAPQTDEARLSGAFLARYPLERSQRGNFHRHRRAFLRRTFSGKPSVRTAPAIAWECRRAALQVSLRMVPVEIEPPGRGVVLALRTRLKWNGELAGGRFDEGLEEDGRCVHVLPWPQQPRWRSSCRNRKQSRILPRKSGQNKSKWPPSPVVISV